MQKSKHPLKTSQGFLFHKEIKIKIKINTNQWSKRAIRSQKWLTKSKFFRLCNFHTYLVHCIYKHFNLHGLLALLFKFYHKATQAEKATKNHTTLSGVKKSAVSEFREF